MFIFILLGSWSRRHSVMQVVPTGSRNVSIDRIPYLNFLDTIMHICLWLSFSLSPLYGKLSDLIGRKPILYSSILVFLVSKQSLRQVWNDMDLDLKGWFGTLWGRSVHGENLPTWTWRIDIWRIECQTWLIIARAVQGVGGGGIIQLVCALNFKLLIVLWSILD